MDNEDKSDFVVTVDELINFITDIDLNVAMKEFTGVAPIELVSLIVKNRKEEE